MNKEEIKYKENYIEVKKEEIKKIEEKLKIYNQEKEECLETRELLENKISEFNSKSDMTRQEEMHVKSLENSLATFNEDILRLTLEINYNNDLLEDLEYDLEMTTEELEKLKNN